MSARKALLAVAAVLLLAAAAAAGYWQVKLKPYFVANKTRHAHMQPIAEGIIRFNTAERRLPRSLEEVVSAGHLPAQSAIYYSPLAHDTLRAKTLSYKECEFVLAFSPKRVVISIPDKPAPGSRYAFVKDSEREWVVTPDLKIFAEPKGG